MATTDLKPIKSGFLNKVLIDYAVFVFNNPLEMVLNSVIFYGLILIQLFAADYLKTLTGPSILAITQFSSATVLVFIINTLVIKNMYNELVGKIPIYVVANRAMTITDSLLNKERQKFLIVLLVLVISWNVLCEVSPSILETPPSIWMLGFSMVYQWIMLITFCLRSNNSYSYLNTFFTAGLLSFYDNSSEETISKCEKVALYAEDVNYSEISKLVLTHVGLLFLFAMAGWVAHFTAYVVSKYLCNVLELNKSNRTA